VKSIIIGTYSEFAKKILSKVGTHGAKKLIVALQKEIDEKEGEK